MGKSLALPLISFISVSLLLASCHSLVRKSAEKKEVSNQQIEIASVRPLFSFQRIPAGSFTMGSPLSERGRDGDEGSDRGQVKVEITKPFEIMTTEVTQRQWFIVMKRNPSYFKRPEDCINYDRVNKLCPDHPVENVSWKLVQGYIKRLNDNLGLINCDGDASLCKGLL